MPETRTGLWFSHTRNFFDHYLSGPAAYWHGPDSMAIGAGGQMQAIHDGAVAWICANWCRNPGQPVDLVGHSRGGYVVMEVARTLNDTCCDCRGISRWLIEACFIPVRFMGLYDPIDMTAGFGRSEQISCNVQFASVVFAAFPVGSGYPPQMTGGPPGGVRSRWYFNRADGGPECPDRTTYREAWLWATHSGIGGAPWFGDRPRGHTRANDIAMAIVADSIIRADAVQAGISLAPLPPGGYGFTNAPQ